MPPDESELKTYIIKRLETNSDADPEVLGDYVLALLKADALQPASKQTYIANLTDFLTDNTEAFVNDLFRAVSTRSFDPHGAAARSTATTHSPLKEIGIVQTLNGSRKRSYHDLENEQTPSCQERGGRLAKHPRRGGRGHETRAGRHSYASTPPYPVSQLPPIPQLPTPPPGMPPLDPQSAMAALLAMQQAMRLIPSIPNAISPRSQRCRDYDVKGFCAAGTSCPFEHGDGPFVIPSFNPEYDPNDSALLGVRPNTTDRVGAGSGKRGRGAARGLGRGRGNGNFRGGGRRADFSQTGPNRDPSVTAIVVEQIPEGDCNEHSVRGFFSGFGAIEDITMQPEEKLAIVKFDRYQAARAAYESPQAVFGNRFVKVYWYNPEKRMSHLAAEAAPTDHDSRRLESDMAEVHEIDVEEIIKRQEKAQRKHEETKQQREETEKQRRDLDAKLRAMDDERKKMTDMIAKKNRDAPYLAHLSSDGAHASSDGNAAKESEQTRKLKAQLAKLEAEAKSLGIDPDAAANGYDHSAGYRGRGGYLARGSGRGRNRGSYSNYRGGWNSSRSGAVMRLDNRPRTVAVAFPDGEYDDHEEAVRQFLLFNSLESEHLQKHPGRDDVALITFQHRYEGEKFMQAAANSKIQHVGKVELSWHTSEEKLENSTNGQSENTDVGRGAIAVSPELPDAPAEEEDLDRWD